MERSELKELLDRWHDRYNHPGFVEGDPVSIPHGFSRKEDIEIGGFLAATIAWGNRKAIVKSARRMVALMDEAPYDFVMHASESDLLRVKDFVHRTFNGDDLLDFIRALRRLYREEGGIGTFFEKEYARHADLRIALSNFRRTFWAEEHYPHAEKHLSSIDKGAACKRLNMYIKWMVRRDAGGVDLGIWTGIPASALYLPLDTHVGTVGRTLGLLYRRADDWKAVEEITTSLRRLDPDDPVRYDFALFGAGLDGLLK